MFGDSSFFHNSNGGPSDSPGGDASPYSYPISSFPESTTAANGDILSTSQFSSFASYDDYLDKQITAIDMFYLEDVELARHLVELGYRGKQ